jgi:hypothetical protein
MLIEVNRLSSSTPRVESDRRLLSTYPTLSAVVPNWLRVLDGILSTLWWNVVRPGTSPRNPFPPCILFDPASLDGAVITLCERGVSTCVSLSYTLWRLYCSTADAI